MSYQTQVDIDDFDLDAALVAMTTRNRQRRKFQTSEDVMAREPDFEMQSIGGAHLPMSYYPHDKDSDEEYLIPPPSSTDPNASWYKRTREALKGDVSSILLLLFLYLLQGVPLGLISALPLVLQGKNVSLTQQAIFSFAYWPFSLKLLWAPIVDSLYWKRIGRRKSWMVPCQYLIGVFMLVMSYKVPYIMGEEEGSSGPNALLLMCIFLPLNFLAATQDIAVDGWALTILSRKNVGYASTCNAVGQTAGYFLGNVVFLTLESASFANDWLRSADNQQDYGIIDLAGYVFFWGIVFIVSTTLVLIFKKEVDNSINQNQKNVDEEAELELGIGETYVVLLKILLLKPMMMMVVILITGKIAFSATDSITSLKLIEIGIPKDKIASFGLFLTPLQIVLPWLIGKWTSGPRPLNIFLWAYPYRLLVGVVFAVLVYFTPAFKDEEGKFSYLVYIVWISAYVLHQVATYSMFVSMMAFNAQVSDPRIGGTFMTLLNTLNNLGGNWPVTVILTLTDRLGIKFCMTKGEEGVSEYLYMCNRQATADQCVAGGDVCETAINGYYVAVGLCTIIGIIWCNVFFRRIKQIQRIPRQAWHVIGKK